MFLLVSVILYTGGVCAIPACIVGGIPACLAAGLQGGACCWGGGWGVLLPGGVWSGGCLLGGVPAPRQGVSGLGGTCLGGCFLQGGYLLQGECLLRGCGLLLWPSVMTFWFGGLLIESGLLVWPSGVIFSYGLQVWPSIPPQLPPLKEDGYCCGRYASYWNVFLSKAENTVKRISLSESCLIQHKKRGRLRKLLSK